MDKPAVSLKHSPCSTPDENECVTGYPTDICDNTPGNKYLCSNCHNVLKRAQQTLCGHRYCAPCLSWIVRNRKYPICPKCIEEDGASVGEDSLLAVERAFSDAAINKEISELQVHCVTAGCGWNGVLKDYDDHQTICEYALILCHTNCGQMIMRRQLADHLENDCSNNMTTCPKCSQALSRSHFSKHKCEKNLQDEQRQRKSEHLSQGKNSNASTSTLKDKCRFSELGCSFKGNREKMKEHEKSSTVTHLAMVLSYISQIKNSLSIGGVTENGHHQHVPNSKGISQQKSFLALHIGELKDENAEIDMDCGQQGSEIHKEPMIQALASRVVELEARVQVFENIISVLNREIDNSNANMAAIEEQKDADKNKVALLEQKVASLECSMAMKDIVLNGLQMHQLSHDQTSFDGIFLWKISDVSMKCHDATTGRAISLYSPAFYTAKYGYKVCLRIYLNGDGAGKGTHVSLFFTVMKGEYDALLYWPFKHKVTFMLLDQSNREHVFDAFRPDIVSASFQRPVADMNVASGCPLFCPLNKLLAPKNSYVKEDAMFIRCIIDNNS